MQKTVVKLYCDDCGNEVKSFQLRVMEGKDEKDLCTSCVWRRLQFTLRLIPVGTKCKLCEGKGEIKNYVSYHNDYTWEKCEYCRGTGQELFKHLDISVKGKKLEIHL